MDPRRGQPSAQDKVWSKKELKWVTRQEARDARLNEMSRYGLVRRPSQMSQRSQQSGDISPSRGRGSVAPAVSPSGPPADEVYAVATRVGEARLVDDDEPRQTITKKFTRQVEVPVTREVKVPIVTRKIVPKLVKKKVATRKYIEVPTTKVVEEEYVDVEEREVTREREVWVKQIVTENVIEPVEVVKKRQVEVPCTDLQSVSDYAYVDVPEDVVEEVDGYRVDEVQDVAVVEVDEFQTFELRPEPTGDVRPAGTRHVGLSPDRSAHMGRTIGADVYLRGDSRVKALDEDSLPDHVPRNHALLESLRTGSPSPRPGSPRQQPVVYERRYSQASRGSAGSARDRAPTATQASPRRSPGSRSDVSVASQFSTYSGRRGQPMSPVQMARNGM